MRSAHRTSILLDRRESRPRGDRGVDPLSSMVVFRSPPRRWIRSHPDREYRADLLSPAMVVFRRRPPGRWILPRHRTECRVVPRPPRTAPRRPPRRPIRSRAGEIPDCRGGGERPAPAPRIAPASRLPAAVPLPRRTTSKTTGSNPTTTTTRPPTAPAYRGSRRRRRRGGRSPRNRRPRRGASSSRGC